jgi:hypothetical protein
VSRAERQISYVRFRTVIGISNDERALNTTPCVNKEPLLETKEDEDASRFARELVAQELRIIAFKSRRAPADRQRRRFDRKQRSVAQDDAADRSYFADYEKIRLVLQARAGVQAL